MEDAGSRSPAQPFFGHSGLGASMKVFPSNSELSERMSLINDGGNEFVASTEPSHHGVVVGMSGRSVATFDWTDQDRKVSFPRKFMRASV